MTTYSDPHPRGTIIALTPTEHRRLLDDWLTERDKVLQLADRLVYLELGDAWTLENHMERKAALLAELNNTEGGRA